MSLKCTCQAQRKEDYFSYMKDLEVVFDKRDVERGLLYYLACPDDTIEIQRPFQLAIESCYHAAFQRKNR
jgi:hypothetical protein